MSTDEMKRVLDKLDEIHDAVTEGKVDTAVLKVKVKAHDKSIGWLRAKAWSALVAVGALGWKLFFGER